MKQKSPYRYEVVQGEKVTFRITSVGASGRVTAVQSGEILTPSGTSENPVFEFSVTKSVRKSHRAILEFSFFGENTDDARFDIVVEGSAGGTFEVPAVSKTSPILDPGFKFKVVVSSPAT